MQSIQDLKPKYLNNSNSNKDLNTIAIAIETKDKDTIAIGDKELDLLLDENCNLYPDSYRSWHAKWIKVHGKQAWLRCVSTARQEGRDPQRYLVWLLLRLT